MFGSPPDWPTLRECWAETNKRSPRDLWDFLTLIPPTPVVRAWWKLRHPRAVWSDYKHRQWIKSLRVGDVLCTCMSAHAKITRITSQDYAYTEDGYRHDLWNCASAVAKDGVSCHGGKR